MDGTGVLFRPLLAALGPGESASVLAYPGDQPLGYDALLSLVLRSLAAEKPFALVAESFSGPLALKVAALCPPRLAAVILCATFVTNPRPLVPSWCAVAVCPALFALVPAFVRTRALLGGYASSTALRALCAEAYKLVRPEVLAGRARAILTVNAEQELRACPYPVLYIRGRYDRVVPEGNLQRIQQCKRGIQVVTVEAPHLVLQVAPGPSLEAIRRFWATVGAV
jgi:pimeloyl-ACP methyl ester carboxylesterase